MVLSSMPVLSELLPDGIHLPWWKRVLSKIKIWGWNIPIHNGLYDSSKLFRELFDPNLLSGDLKTAIAITAYIPTIDATVVSYNVPLNKIPSKVLIPELMPHDNYRYDPITPVWVLACQSSAIPFNFYNVPLLLPLDEKDKRDCEDLCGIFNFTGNGEEKRAWQITGKGLFSMQNGNGFAVEDGAVTTNLGAVGANIDKNKIIVSIYPVKKAKPIKFDDRTRWAQWKAMVGPIYQVVKAGKFLFTDSTADKQMMLSNLYMKIEDSNGVENYYKPTVIEIDVPLTRNILEKRNGRKYPSWTDFNQYDKKTTLDIFEESYNQAMRKINKGDPSVGRSPLFSKEDLIRMGHEGISICLSGGGAAAVDEVAYTAAILDSIDQYRENISNIPKSKRSIVNLLTGTSAGALTAAYFANLHDSYCSPENR